MNSLKWLLNSYELYSGADGKIADNFPQFIVKQFIVKQFIVKQFIVKQFIVKQFIVKWSLKT